LPSISHFERGFLGTYLIAEWQTEGNYSDERVEEYLTVELDQFFAQGFGNRFGFGMNLEFAVDIFQVKGDGMKRDAERVGGSLLVMSFD
jgi:hypothetical protein